MPAPAVEERPLRNELLSIDLLGTHARQLAQNCKISDRKSRNLLLTRLIANERVLREFNVETLRAEKSRSITPAAEWLLDNFHLIEEQIRTTQRHLPRNFSFQLPQLTEGTLAGYPRVYQMAQELISHSDGRIDAAHLASFTSGYQDVARLKLGELWAIPIMLRLALIENLRRTAVLLNVARHDRDQANEWADAVLEVAEKNPAQLIVVVGEMARFNPVLTPPFVAEFLRRIQEKSTSVKLAVSWIEERLAADGLTVAQLLQSESQNQATTQVSVGNCIGSLRFVDAMDWQEFVESQSIVEQILLTDPAEVYAHMDFATRDSYRHTIERIARFSKRAESEVAVQAIALAREQPPADDNRRRHVGYYLTGKGMEILERAVRLRLPIRDICSRVVLRYPLAFYLGGILAVTFAVTFRLLWWAARRFDITAWESVALTSVIVLSASQLGVALVNWLATIFVRPAPLPRLDYARGIPATHATLVVVPTMLGSSNGIENLLEALEVRYLANADRNVFFALLTDFRDAQQEHLPADAELVRQVSHGIAELNEKYKSDRPNIFYLFHRPRRWNAREKLWMGYERKRGKLAGLNHLLRGGGREVFSQITGDLALLPHIKYVITLDTDTQLPRDAARELAATMGHPLNCPVYDNHRGLVVEGYSILQPRVAVSLPAASRSRFVKLFSGDAGIDPYTRAVSDVYQDVFQEGSFIGKGIYDVDAFELAVGGKFPENRILSHDLLEGSYARSALVSDIQLFEDFPSRYQADTRRRHRWMRGDWQIATWLLPRLPGADVRRVQNPLTDLSRWKIFDNLRRSLVPLGLLAMLALGWLKFSPAFALWSGFVLAIIGLPALLQVLTELLSKSKELPGAAHLNSVAVSTWKQICQCVLTIAFLPYDAMISLDAIVRTLTRLLFTRRNLLEWQTAHDLEQTDDGSLRSFFATMWCAPILAVALALLTMFVPHAWPAAFPFVLLWLVSPGLAWWISLPLAEKRADISEDQTRQLHVLARKTWAFFDTFVTAQDHWLPPDNFQEYPRAALATRTSPTNMGMAVIGTLAAHDFGYLSLPALMRRSSRTLETLEKLERHRGHFYNWYDTRTLKPMLPLYLSTVDNGNLAGLLLTVHTGLLEMADQNWSLDKVIRGLRATLDVLKESAREPNLLAGVARWEKQLAAGQASSFSLAQALETLITSADSLPAAGAREESKDFELWRRTFAQCCRDHREEMVALFPWLPSQERLRAHAARQDNHALKEILDQLAAPSLNLIADNSELWAAQIAPWAEAEAKKADSAEVAQALADLGAALAAAGRRAQQQILELENLARRCEALARMDFTLLYDPARELFSIGYNVSQHKLDANYYDLLASEARLTSFVAIALGQVEQTHWFRLGRSLTTSGGKPTLISWSGSMFEYLMPLLVMPACENTLLDYSCKSAVARQIDYGRQIHVPWGISESGYNLRDTDANYQYRAFGIPGLGFKRGLAEDIVIAPYATVMALMVAPEAACKNLAVLRREKAEGQFGFYEALDYTPARVPNGQTHAVVRSFMAHHEGMSLLALAYLLLDRPMQRRFNSNPLFKSAELLLHERVPKQTSVLYPHELEASAPREPALTTESSLRVFTDPNSGTPKVHLLSNGHYHVMITNAGGGSSRWNELALTRWREDPTRDCWGTFFYLRDLDSGQFWSAAHQPTLEPKPGFEAIFSQGRAEFRTRREDVDSHTEISVSPENDVEVRRITLTNHSDETRKIEVTTYAEIVLNAFAADLSHPAFSNLFIQTEILPGKHAIVFSRRPRAAGEKTPWLFHLLLVHGPEIGEASFETDRAKFLGRAGTPASPLAMNHRVGLSNREGSALDPIATLRRAVELAPKASATVTLVCGIAPMRAEMLGLVDKYQDQTIADRCFELAWTHSLVGLRHSNMTEAEAQTYAQLASAILYHQAARRAQPALLARNQRGQRFLWSLGISGDLPIVLIYSTHLDRLELVRQLIQAHAYWRLKGLTVDLVILNEDESVYRQNLHDQILNLITAANAALLLDKPGGIFLRRRDQVAPEDRLLLEANARIFLQDEQGALAEQLERRGRILPLPPSLRARARRSAEPAPVLAERELLFFNGLGGFTTDGREYVITLQPGAVTPAPWINVLANPNFGALVSESGGGYTWSENCHEFRLTPWNNDATTDVSGEAFYLRDDQTGAFWSPTPLPARGPAPYVVRHGFGYSIFEHTEEGIESEMTVFVHVSEPVKFTKLKIRNLSRRTRRLSVMGFWEWVLGETRQKNAIHITTEIDPPTGAVLARNYFNADFAGHVAFVTCSRTPHACTGDRTEFLGRNGTLAQPAALKYAKLSGKTGAGLDPCAALQVPLELEPGEEQEVVFILGAEQNLDRARDLIQKFRDREACQEAHAGVWSLWKRNLDAVYVETPEPALNLLANGWLLYQTIACRLWARSGYYQSGGAFGFRDQLQDAMALVHARPELLRQQILYAAGHQFREGDAQHWWHPPMDRGVRTHFSDDFLWLPYAVCRYVETIGDTGVLDEKVPFLESRLLKPEEESLYDLPNRAAEGGTLYEHCVRAVRHGWRFGEHGLPLMGCGDWNDGMNLVGAGGKGESVWLAFFIYDLLRKFSGLAERRGDKAFARECETVAATLSDNLAKNAWDGQWYRRAYFDNGVPLGSATNPECQIDSLPQSWAILSGSSNFQRSQSALDAVMHRLVRRDSKLIQLFDPPFDKSTLEPGYIKGYAPGVRENGGQYTHAAVWTVMATALFGESARAWDLFKLINPVLHAATPADAERYKVEPYVMAGDVYSLPPHTGRGGWTWYTGSAGWMYRLMIETFLGLELVVDELRFIPRIPQAWKEFKVAYRFRETTYRLTCVNASGLWKTPPTIIVDGQEQTQALIKLIDDRREHLAELRF